VELPALAKMPDPASGPFAMTISSLLRTERTADLRPIFMVRRDLNQLELDSHTDTCVAGANTRVTDYTNTKVSVSPFLDSYEAIKDVPIATVATAWDDPDRRSECSLHSRGPLFRGQYVPHSALPESTSRQWMEGPGHAEAIRCRVGPRYHQSYRYSADASGDERRDLLSADTEANR
jgi:hypothetical protein